MWTYHKKFTITSLFDQGSTVPANSKVVVHWCKEFSYKTNAGMAYVSLGRSEQIKDIYINGKVQAEGIHADPAALEETYRLQTLFDKRVEKMNQRKDNFWKVSYLNVRSLKLHKRDVEGDNFMMSADIFCLGETWLKIGEKENFVDYKGCFANYGKGKGVSAYSKIDCYQLNKVESSSYSAIHVRTNKFDSIFLYLSADCNKEDICQLLESWIDKGVPTSIMGDVNINFSRSCSFTRFLEQEGFQQMIQKPTCDTGSLIDHIYVNKPLQNLEIWIDQCAAYYSDHDIVTLYIKK